MDISTKPIVF